MQRFASSRCSRTSIHIPTTNIDGDGVKLIFFMKNIGANLYELLVTITPNVFICKCATHLEELQNIDNQQHNSLNKEINYVFLFFQRQPCLCHILSSSVTKNTKYVASSGYIEYS